jgi:hypothetical protein
MVVMLVVVVTPGCFFFFPAAGGWFIFAAFTSEAEGEGAEDLYGPGFMIDTKPDSDSESESDPDPDPLPFTSLWLTLSHSPCSTISWTSSLSLRSI